MPDFQIGLLFSTSGPYSALGQSARDGALLALEEVNAAGEVRLRARIADPQGVPSEYERLIGEMVKDGDINHVVGGITSWSRKDMIPVLERHGGLLWYPCPYEGFETSDNVVYLGACANQHLLPIIDHVAQQPLDGAFLVGSNYVWGWETLRVARERLADRGIPIVGESYLPLGDQETAHLMTEIAASRPGVIVNSLIGPSNHAFMRALTQLKEDGLDVTVVSANQTEADLDALGSAADGMLTIAAWFESLADAQTAQLRSRIAARFGPDYRASCYFATAYTAVKLLAHGLARAGRDDPRSVFQAVAGIEYQTVLGPISVDPITRHTSLTPRLAVARRGAFEITANPGSSVAPDPYLTRVAAAPRVAEGRPNLRIVS
ncbi:transporter substrate-binding protein [Thalassovita mangrovi]|uniref:Transporter substrate-binding protein n=1 Tax=Thalassovita mangrovi TaxID=2692236 RepID=A0A6L8LS68_9RHOB|nr:transporter substrate-binding protein [Thalassovita mangrovi]MYM56332.1 transporter substrate-binding protein [Thalassovita mangrovi]